DDQVRLINIVYEQFVQTQAFEQNIYIDQEDEKFSDDHYSETVDTETQTQKDYPRNGSEESIIHEE
ncbi:11092_t:CDS:1, partial [Ambispora gerdemannii]